MGHTRLSAIAFFFFFILRHRTVEISFPTRKCRIFPTRIFPLPVQCDGWKVGLFWKCCKNTWIDPRVLSISIAIQYRFGRETIFCVGWDQKPALDRLWKATQNHFYRTFIQRTYSYNETCSREVESSQLRSASPCGLRIKLASKLDFHLFASMRHGLAELRVTSYENVRKWKKINEWFARK